MNKASSLHKVDSLAGQYKEGGVLKLCEYKSFTLHGTISLPPKKKDYKEQQTIVFNLQTILLL